MLELNCMAERLCTSRLQDSPCVRLQDASRDPLRKDEREV